MSVALDNHRHPKENYIGIVEEVLKESENYYFNLVETEQRKQEVLGTEESLEKAKYNPEKLYTKFVARVRKLLESGLHKNNDSNPDETSQCGNTDINDRNSTRSLTTSTVQIDIKALLSNYYC